MSKINSATTVLVEDLSQLVTHLWMLRVAAALPRDSGPFAAWLAARNIPAPAAMGRSELEAAIAWIERGLRTKPDSWTAACGRATHALIGAGARYQTAWDHPLAIAFRSANPVATAENLIAFAEQLESAAENPASTP